MFRWRREGKKLKHMEERNVIENIFAALCCLPNDRKTTLRNQLGFFLCFRSAGQRLKVRIVTIKYLLWYLLLPRGLLAKRAAISSNTKAVHCKKQQLTTFWSACFKNSFSHFHTLSFSGKLVNNFFSKSSSQCTKSESRATKCIMYVWCCVI